MPKKRSGLIILIPLFAIIFSVFWLTTYPVPTDQVQSIYLHLKASTSGDGPVIGIADVDPLTDVIFHKVGEPVSVTFLFLSPAYRVVDENSIRYATGDGVEVVDATVEEIDMGVGWSACFYHVVLVADTDETQYITVMVADSDGFISSRLFYIIVLG